jgi:outer membrane protein assembly factor BamB
MSLHLRRRLHLPGFAAVLVVAIAGWLGGVRPVPAADWPQFRGPNCTGMSNDSQPLPTEFSATQNLAWSAELGDGVGGAVVANGKVFVPAMTAAETISLFAFDAATGKKLWQRDWPTGPLPEIHHTNSHASTTPAADAERVYFYFSTLGMLAVDAQTGADVWRHTLPVPFYVFKWGPGMSPVLHDDLVVFCQDDDLFPAIYAFDKATGTVRWKEDRQDMAANYSHPVVCTANGRTDLVVAGTGMLIGYDPATGKRRWFAKTLLRNIKTTPVVRGDVIYISVQSKGIANQWLASVDAAKTGNNDGKLTRDEIQAFVGAQKVPEVFFAKTFGRGDLDRDGDLEGEEIDAAFLHPDNFAGARFSVPSESAADEFVLAVRGGGEGDVTGTHVLWKHPTKHTDHIVSPLVSDGRMLLVKCGGISTAFETGAGESIRKAKRISNGGDYFASPVYGDGKIYVASDNGTVVVLKDSPDYEVLAANDLEDAIVATPAISDGRLFIRTRTKLLCAALK